MSNFIIPSGHNSDATAKAKIKNEMDSLCHRIGIPIVIPGIYYIVDYRTKNGTEYKPMWGKVGYLFLLHMDRRGSPSIEVEMLGWSRENGGRATAHCVVTYGNGDRYAEYGDSHIDEFDGRDKHTFHHTDTMARTRAMERCAVLATADGLTLVGYGRSLSKPVVVEVQDNGDM